LKIVAFLWLKLPSQSWSFNGYGSCESPEYAHVCGAFSYK